MAETLRIIESTPAARPAVSGLSAAAAAVPAEAVWRRLEGWCAHRWGVRTAVILVQGGGVWEPRLRPWALLGAERWDAGDWAPFAPAAHPMGFALDGCDDPLRFTFEVGDATATPDVQEAFRRLAAWMAEAERELAAGTASLTDASDGDFSFKRSPQWIARGLQASGAADLLRPWRHV